jgi:hypothetical protein
VRHRLSVRGNPAGRTKSATRPGSLERVQQQKLMAASKSPLTRCCGTERTGGPSCGITASHDQGDTLQFGLNTIDRTAEAFEARKHIGNQCGIYAISVRA